MFNNFDFFQDVYHQRLASRRSTTSVAWASRIAAFNKITCLNHRGGIHSVAVKCHQYNAPSHKTQRQQLHQLRTSMQWLRQAAAHNHWDVRHCRECCHRNIRYAFIYCKILIKTSLLVAHRSIETETKLLSNWQIGEAYAVSHHSTTTKENQTFSF